MKKSILPINFLFYSLVVVTLTAQDTSEIIFGISPQRFVEAPTNVKASDGSIYRIEVSWEEVQDCERYHLYRGKNFYQMKKLPKTVTSVGTYDNDNLESEILYYYRIKAQRGHELSDWSAYDSGFIKAFAFNTIPTLLSPKSNSPKEEPVTFSWVNVNNATQYRLQIISQDYNTWTPNNGYTNHPFIVLDTLLPSNQIALMLSSSTAFAWTVQAIKEQETSDFSPFKEFILTDPNEVILSNQDRSDLAIIAVDLEQDTLSTEDYLIVETLLANEGNSDAFDIQLSFFLSENQALEASDIKLGQYQLDTLSAFRSFRITPVKQLPQNIAEGTYYLIVVSEEEHLLGTAKAIPIWIDGK